MKKLLLTSILAGLSISSALAAETTGNFQATSTLNSTCVISAEDINFGNLAILNYSNAPKQTGVINLLCSKGVNYALTPEGGYNLSGSSYQGIFHILRGTGINKDGLVVSLEKTNGGSWTRDLQGTTGPITGTATGINQAVNFKLDISDRGGLKSIDPTLTNATNRTASPDVYSTAIGVKITY